MQMRDTFFFSCYNENTKNAMEGRQNNRRDGPVEPKLASPPPTQTGYRLKSDLEETLILKCELGTLQLWNPNYNQIREGASMLRSSLPQRNSAPRKRVTPGEDGAKCAGHHYRKSV